MPVWDESAGRWRAVLSDYLTATKPTLTTPRWGFAFSVGVTVERYTSTKWQTFLVDPSLGADMDAMTAVYGVDGGKWDSIGQTAYATNISGSSLDDMKARAEARAALIGYSVGLWVDASATESTSTGPVVEQHFVDTGAWDRTATSAALLAEFRTTGTTPWNFDPVADWQDSVDGYLAAAGWRYAVPQLTSQRVLPLANRTNVSGTKPTKGLIATIGKVLTLNDVHFYIPRASGDEDACAWSKLLRWKDLRTSPDPLVTARPAIRTGEGAVERRERVYPLLRNDTGLTVKWHFATVDGSDSPSTQAEAQTMIGVDDGAVDWATWGIAGLRAKPAGGYFSWFGRSATPLNPAMASKPLRLTLVVVPADLTPIGLTTLAELLAEDGVYIAAQWELWPESATGPTLTYDLRTDETIRADIDMTTGARIGGTLLGGAAPGGADGGGF